MYCCGYISVTLESSTLSQSDGMPDEQLNDQVAIAQTRVLLDSVRINAMASFITAMAVVVLVSREHSLYFLIPWFCIFALIIFARFLHSRSVAKAELGVDNYKRVLIALTAFSVLTSTAWGTLGYFSIDDEMLVTSLIVLMVFTGLVANAAATLAASLPVCIGFIVPILVPAAIKFYSFGETQFYWVTALIILYLTITLINIRRIRESFRQSIELRFENLGLIEGLKTENAKTQAALENAEQANMAKSRFFAAASHDLRQPLQSLSMFTATLATENCDKSQRKIVGQIENSVRSLEGLFNSLLDISSLDAGTLKFHKQHVSLQVLVNQIAQEFNEQARLKSLSFDVDVGDDAVYTDPVLFGRLMRNLIENAIRYTKSGGITIRSEIVDDHIQLSVIDTGIGISTEMQSRVFDEFVQLNNPERDRTKGLGLGLSIVQRICKLLEIKLNLVSIVDRGTAFSIDIERGDASLLTQQSDSGTDYSAVAQLFVIIIDDEEDARLSLEGLLFAWGCEVMVAGSGEEAVKQLREYGTIPDVLITDYRLRNNETGGDAMVRIREYCGNELPTIVVTGDIAPDRLIEIDKLNVPVLHKPCSPERLRSLLHNVAISG